MEPSYCLLFSWIRNGEIIGAEKGFCLNENCRYFDLPPKTGPDVMLGSGRKLIRRRQDNIPLKTNWVKSKKNRGQNP